MTLSIALMRDDIVAKAEADFAQPIYRGGVPTLETLIMTNGRVNPYIVINFSDIIRQGSKTFAGTRGDDHIQPINFFCVAPHPVSASDAPIAEQLQVKVIDKFLGYNVLYGGEMVKRPGGGMYVMADATSKPVADIAFVSFNATVQVLDIPETS